MSKELLSKIEWTCKMKKVKPENINGTLRIVEHTNLAYVEPHRISLQIGQAIQNEKIQNIEENIKEIRTFIEDKYIMKDLHDVQIENLKEKINELEEEINNLKK